METVKDHIDFVKDASKFAFLLYKQVLLKKYGENVVLSPFAIELCLAYLFTAARGRSADEIQSTLFFESYTTDNLCDKYKVILGRDKKFSSQLILANKFYVNHKIRTYFSFEQLTRNNFYSDIASMDLSETDEVLNDIKNWIKYETNDKYTLSLDSSIIMPNLTSLIVNAIFFKGEWEFKFNPENTKKDKFWINNEQSIMTEMMIRLGREKFRYARFNEIDSTGLIMHFKDCCLAFFMLLPNRKDGLYDLERSLQSFNLAKLTNLMKCKKVFISMPKFKIEFQSILNSTFQRLGITSIFTDNAYFGNIVDYATQLKISEIIHKTFIEINEDGGEPIAKMNAKNMKLEDCEYFIADHPFLYFVIDEYHHIYFYGKICHPYTV